MTMMTQVDFGKVPTKEFSEIPTSCCFEHRGWLYAKSSNSGAVAIGTGTPSVTFSPDKEVTPVHKIQIVRG